MKFGSVENPEEVNFQLPASAAETRMLLKQATADPNFKVSVGCAKWNKADLKGFYPRGTKDELSYYSRQFNAIELNATFYKMPTAAQVNTWKAKTPLHFKFYPKITNTISHFKRLSGVKDAVNLYCDAISHFEDQLGRVFLQLHDNFKPTELEKLALFLEDFPKVIPLAVEVRNADWFKDKSVQNDYYTLLKKHGASNIIVDAAGRRDLLHMQLSNNNAFIRYVGANHSSDKKRLDDWLLRIKEWREQGLNSLEFFVHQNIELESPLLAAYFIEKLNTQFKLNLEVPAKPDVQKSLF